MADNPQFEKASEFSQYSTGAGFSTGVQPMDQLLGMLTMLLGRGGLAPRSGEGSSLYDGYLNRQRSQDFMRIMPTAFGNSPVLQRLGGVNQESPFFRMAGFMASPDSPISKVLGKFQNGDPVAAQQQLYANMTGMTMKNFGGSGDITFGQSSDLMDVAYKNLYHKREITGQDVFSAVKDRQRSAGDYLKKDTRAAEALSPFMTNGELNLFAGKDDPERKKMLDTYKKALETRFKDDKAGLDKAMQGVTSGIGGLNQLQALANSGASVPGTTNYERTRGFKLQDFTRGFAEASSLGMLGGGGDRSRSANDRMMTAADGFNKYAGGAMEAARSLFGTSTGKESIAAINEFVGSSKIDLSNEQSSDQVEDVLRRVKGVAKTAGISIQSMLGIINEGRQLAESNPQLRQLGGLEISQMASKALVATAGLTSALGGDFIRRNGGQVAVTQQLMNEQLGSTQEPIAQRAYAVHNQLKLMAAAATDPAEKARIEAGIQQLGRMSSDPAFSNMYSFNKGLEDISRTTGISSGVLLRGSMSKYNSAQGLRDNVGLGMSFTATAAATQFDSAVNAQLDVAFSGKGGSAEGQRQIAELMSKKGFSYMDAIKSLGVQGLDTQYNAYKGTIETAKLRKYSAAFRQSEALDNAANDAYTANSKDFSKRFAKFNAGISDNFINAVMGGTVTTNWVEEISGMLKDPNGVDANGGILYGMKDFGNSATDRNASVLLNSLGNNSDPSSVAAFKNLSANFTLDQISEFAGSEEEFKKAKATNKNLANVSYADVKKAAGVMGGLSSSQRKLYAGKTMTASDFKSALSKTALGTYIDRSADKQLATLGAESSKNIISTLADRTGKDANGLDKVLNGNQWEGMKNIYENYATYDKSGKMTGIDVEKYARDKARYTDGLMGEDEASTFGKSDELFGKAGSGYFDKWNEIHSKAEQSKKEAGDPSNVADLVSKLGTNMPQIADYLKNIDIALKALSKS